MNIVQAHHDTLHTRRFTVTSTFSWFFWRHFATPDSVFKKASHSVSQNVIMWPGSQNANTFLKIYIYMWAGPWTLNNSTHSYHAGGWHLTTKSNFWRYFYFLAVLWQHQSSPNPKAGSGNKLSDWLSCYPWWRKVTHHLWAWPVWIIFFKFQWKTLAALLYIFLS